MQLGQIAKIDSRDDQQDDKDMEVATFDLSGTRTICASSDAGFFQYVDWATRFCICEHDCIHKKDSFSLLDHDIFANYFALFDHMLLDVQIQTAHIHLTKNNFQGDKLGMKSNVETRKILGMHNSVFFLFNVIILV
ncbi:hypothetical protein ACJX0J_006465 [Zea mays]